MDKVDLAYPAIKPSATIVIYSTTKPYQPNSDLFG